MPASVPAMRTGNGPANVAEVPYMEGFSCKPDVRTLIAMKSTRK